MKHLRPYFFILALALPLGFFVAPGFASAAGCSGYAAAANVSFATTTGAVGNFPVMIAGTYSFLATTGNGGQLTNADGYDICWSDTGNTTQYPQEIINYSSSTGALYAAVQVPSLNTSTRTSALLWYGSSSVSVNPSTSTVWDSNFVGVYHLQENGHPYHDSSQAAANSTTSTDPAQASGLNGFSQTFNGSNTFIGVPNEDASGGSMTVTGFMKMSGIITNNSVFYDNRNPVGLNHGFVAAIGGSGAGSNAGKMICFPSSGAAVWNGSINFTDGDWHQLGCTTDNTTMTYYGDGSTLTSFGDTGNNFTGGASTSWIGAAFDPSYGSSTIEEIRISNIARSAAWVAAENTNFTHPTMFTTISPACTITGSLKNGSNLPGAYTNVPYSDTVKTSGCAAPNFSVISGSLPAGLSLSSMTGIVSGTPTAATTTNFTVQASDTNGTSTLAYTFTVASPTTENISGFTLTTHSSVSLLATWTTNTSSTSQVECGTNTGGPYTTAVTPVVNPIQLGSSTFWGVTSHFVAVTGLPNPSTTYFCVVASTNATGGSATSSELSALTAVTATTTPLAVVSVSPPTRINDQYNGANGMPIRDCNGNATTTGHGCWIDGDTEYTTWGDDGNTYSYYADGIGLYGGSPSGLGFVKWDPKYLSPTVLQILQPNTGLNGDSWYENGAFSARGIQYAFINNGAGIETCCVNVLKSSDHWNTSVSPERDGGPNTTPVGGLDLPPIYSATITGSTYSTSTGNITLTTTAWTAPPPVGSELVITGSTNCDEQSDLHLVTASDATHVTFPWSNVSCTVGTIKYMTAMAESVVLPGAGNGFLAGMAPIQPCQDYGGANGQFSCQWQAGDDGWVYMNTLYDSLIRVRIEDMPLQDISKYQCYDGVQGTNDGLFDSAWHSVTTGPCEDLSGYGSGNAGTANKTQLDYIPDFNRYVLSVYNGPNGCSNGDSLYDLGQYPWGIPVPIGSINRDLRYPGLCPGFPNAILSSYSKTSSNPLTAQMMWVTSGGGMVGTRNSGIPDNYSPFTWNIVFTASSTVQTKAKTSVNANSLRTHIANGLQVFYDFKETAGGPTIPDVSPNDTTDAYGFVGSGNYPISVDQYGLVLTSPGGDVNSTSTDGNDWSATSPKSIAFTTPYTEALNSFTLFACFGHYPYLDGIGNMVFPIVNGEVAVAKNAGDFAIQRNGSSANWNISVKNTLLGSVPLADGTIGCFAVRANGTAATVYSSGAIGNSLPLTPTLGPTAVSASGAAGALTIGSNNSSTGVLSDLLVYDRALSDSELIREMAVLRADMATRGVMIP